MERKLLVDLVGGALVAGAVPWGSHGSDKFGQVRNRRERASLLDNECKR